MLSLILMVRKVCLFCTKNAKLALDHNEYIVRFELDEKFAHFDGMIFEVILSPDGPKMNNIERPTKSEKCDSEI